MKSTMASTGEVIDFDTGDRMAAPAPAGHNNPPIDLPDNFKVDYARALRWKAYNTPKLNKGDGFLLCFLSDHFKFGGNGANIPISYICRVMGEAERTVQRRIERLSKLDWVGKEEARGTIPTRWSVILTPEEYEEQISRAVQAVRKKAVRDDKSDTPRPPRGDNPDASTHIGVTNLTPLGQQVQCEPFRGDNPDAPTGCQNALGVPSEVARDDRTVTQQPIQRQAGRQAAPSPSERHGGEVADEALRQQREEMFGPGMMPSARRLARFLNVNVNHALDVMDAHAGSASPGVVLNAIAKLDLAGLDNKGQPIQDRMAWFEKGVEFARADADGKWLEPSKQTTAPDRPMRDGYPVNSEGKNIFELFGYDTPTEGCG